MTNADATIQEAKRKLRERMRAALAGMPREERARQSEAVCERLLAMPDCKAAKTIMLFLPLPDEPDVLPAAERWLAEGKVVCVPLVDWEGRTMQPVRVDRLETDAFENDRHGLRRPVKRRHAGGECDVVPVERLDVVLVPGLAFDGSGNRLGRGGGIYDRFMTRLPQRAKRVGVAFTEQLVDGAIPAVGHDVMVDEIVRDGD